MIPDQERPFWIQHPLEVSGKDCDDYAEGFEKSFEDSMDLKFQPTPEEYRLLLNNFLKERLTEREFEILLQHLFVLDLTYANGFETYSGIHTDDTDAGYVFMSFDSDVVETNQAYWDKVEALHSALCQEGIDAEFYDTDRIHDLVENVAYRLTTFNVNVLDWPQDRIVQLFERMKEVYAVEPAAP